VGGPGRIAPYQGWLGARRPTGYGDDEANEAIRLSWCQLTPGVEWEAVARRILSLR
jgi:hypothetical protein